jgi:hypothetical protein
LKVTKSVEQVEEEVDTEVEEDVDEEVSGKGTKRKQCHDDDNEDDKVAK